MRRIIFSLFFLISIISLSGHFLFAQESGAFLEMPISARASGMGDSFTAIADDPLGIYYNPAGIAFIKYPSVSLVYHKYIQDISGNSLAFVYPLKNWAIGLAPTVFKMEEEPVSDSLGNDTGDTFGYQGTIIPVAAAWKLGNLAVGLSVKSYSEELDRQSSKTNTYDAGAIYRMGSWQFGFASQNLGGKIFSYDLAKTQRIGIAYAGSGYLLSVENKKYKIGHSFSAGGEVSLADALKLRGGWRFWEDFGGLTFGLGGELGGLDFDYAFLSYGDLGNAHKVGVSYKFGKAVSKKEAVTKPEPTTQLPKEKIGLAIMELKPEQVSSTDAALITDSLYTEVTKTNAFIVIERNKLQQAMDELKHQQAGLTDQETAVEVGKILNAQKVLVGSVGKLEEIFLVNIRLVDVRTSQVIWAEKGSGSSLVEVTQKVVRELALQMMKVLQ